MIVCLLSLPIYFFLDNCSRQSIQPTAAFYDYKRFPVQGKFASVDKHARMEPIGCWQKMLIISGAAGEGESHYKFISIPRVSPKPATFDYNQLGLRSPR